MYAGQTKRLCVRGAAADDTRVHQTTTPTANPNTQPQPQPQQPQQLHQQSPLQSPSSPLQATKNVSQQQQLPSFHREPNSHLCQVTNAQQPHNQAPSTSAAANTMTASNTTAPSGPPPKDNKLTVDNGATQISAIAKNITCNTTTSNKQHLQPNLAPTRGPLGVSQTAEFAYDVSMAAAAVASLSPLEDSAILELINRLTSGGQNDDTTCALQSSKQSIISASKGSKLEILLTLRNLITACNKKKDLIINHPNFNKLVALLEDETLNSLIKTQIVLLLCSIAKGGGRNVKTLNEALVDEKIFALMARSREQAVIEACLRCLRSMMLWPGISRTWLIYDFPITASDSETENQKSSSVNSNLRAMVLYAQMNPSFVVQECIADIFAATCIRTKDQMALFKAQAVPCIAHLLDSSSYRVVISALNWLTQICQKNHAVSLQVTLTKCPSGALILDRLTQMMNKDESNELQFLAARCVTHIYRAPMMESLRNDSRIITHVLPTLVRMVHSDKPPQLRIKSAETIAHLIVCDVRLQETASVCDHLIECLAGMLNYENDPSSPLDLMKHSTQLHYRCSRVLDNGVSWVSVTTDQTQLPALPPSSLQDKELNDDQHSSRLDPETELSFKNGSSTGDSQSNQSLELSSSLASNSDSSIKEMKCAAFLALAALASNLEPIRKKILSTGVVMKHLVKCLNNSDTKTLKSVLTCLLSLSRSVQQLRTSFAENSVYSALKRLLNVALDEILTLVLAILCNISLDFSPGKQHFLDSQTIDILCNLTRKPEPILKLHGVWILMNMTYQQKDQNLKFQILRSLGIHHLLGLLETRNHEELVLKTLGLLRNLLSQKSHIDAIMSTYGEHILPSLMRLLERPCSVQIREQCLCVITNIADGIDAKAFIMNYRNVLNYLASAMCDEQATGSRLAALCCITNLAHKEHPGSQERRHEMKKLGIDEKLKSLLNSTDPIVSDRVRTAYNHFVSGPEDDKYVN